MPVTVVAFLSINEDEPMALAEYFRVTAPLLERANAKIVKRFVLQDDLVGRKPAKTVVIVEYPDRTAVNSVFCSVEYEQIKGVRDQAFLEYSVTFASDAERSDEPALTLD